MRYLFGFICVLALGVMGCGEGGGGPPDSSPYASKDLWLCRPDIENDRCDTADLSMTEIRPDGSHVTSEVARNPDAKVDCFYVYDTVNPSSEAGNTEVLVPHPDSVIRAVFRNGAHYRGVCRMFAPLYHQMSNGTYYQFVFSWEPTEYFQRAYDDVVEAFEYYIRNHNDGRDFVLVGNGQGSHIFKRLLQDKVDNDEALRGHLLSAVLLNNGGAVQVPEGERVGGSFVNIPLCTSVTETGCVIAFDAVANGPGSIPSLQAGPVEPPMARVCVNPASFDGSTGTLAALVYPRTHEDLIPFPSGVDTEWVRFPNIYTSRCAALSSFGDVFEIDLASEYQGDVPITPQELQTALQEVWEQTLPNLHSAESFIANTDLVRIVEEQIASRNN
jgi:hypothetical protein